MEQNRQAYITVLSSENYLEGVRTLLYSIINEAVGPRSTGAVRSAYSEWNVRKGQPGA